MSSACACVRAHAYVHGEHHTKDGHQHGSMGSGLQYGHCGQILAGLCAFPLALVRTSSGMWGLCDTRPRSSVPSYIHSCGGVLPTLGCTSHIMCTSHVFLCLPVCACVWGITCTLRAPCGYRVTCWNKGWGNGQSLEPLKMACPGGLWAACCYFLQVCGCLLTVLGGSWMLAGYS